MTSAFDRGLQSLRAGDLTQARNWLERARRLEPRDASVALALGSVMIRQCDPESVALHEQLLQAAALNEGFCGLASACWMMGDFQKAAETRALSLRRFAQRLSTNQVGALADFARAAGALGWCALGSDGHLTLCITDPVATGGLSASLDGTPFWSQPDRAHGGTSYRAALPGGWESARLMRIDAEQGFLLGAEIDIADIVRVEGIVEARDGGLEGWAWCPHDPDHAPVIALRVDDKLVAQVTAQASASDVRHWRPLARPRAFAVTAAALTGCSAMMDVVGRDGRSLYGAPLDPFAWLRSAAIAARIDQKQKSPRSPHPARLLTAIPATLQGPPRTGATPARRCSIIIPVHGAREATLACVRLAVAECPDWARIVVVDDASDDPHLVAKLQALHGQSSITLLQHAANTGFPGAANTGLRHCAGDDVVLLNSDTLLPPRWVERLRHVAYSAADIGTVTPLSNDATILSYPCPDGDNPIPDLAQTRRLDGYAAAGNLGPIDIPTGIGFCLFIKWRCHADLGELRADVFAQGYGEENDYCLRARHLGWRHVAAPTIYVGHIGGQSFGGARDHLRARNARLLNALHPGYDELVGAFIRRDPMAVARRVLDRELWIAARTGRRAVLLITHGRKGGVRRRVMERAAALQAQGKRPILLWPVGGRHGGKDCVLGDGPQGGTPNLRFAIPDELDSLTDLLRGDGIERAEVHSLVGHDHAVLDLCARLHIAYDIVVHDYAWFCPRINLLDGAHRYCGEPAIEACEACVADHGYDIEEAIPVRDLVARSTCQLAQAERVVTPSHDCAARIARHFPHIAPTVESWEDDDHLPPIDPPRAKAGPRRVCVVGAIGYQKGFDILLACARDATRRALDLEFIVVGYSCDDGRLLAARAVQITGEYAEDEAVSLIRSQGADIAFMPAVWPETWSYTLSQAWQAGLEVVAFDVGAPAERIRRSERGWLLATDTRPGAINDFLLTAAAGRSRS